MDLSFGKSTKATYRIVVHIHGEEREGRSVQAHHATAGFHGITATIPTEFSQTEGELWGKLVIRIEVKDTNFVFGFAGKVVVITSEKSINVDFWGELALYPYTQAADGNIGNTAYSCTIDKSIGIGINISCPKGCRYIGFDVGLAILTEVFSKVLLAPHHRGRKC